MVFYFTATGNSLYVAKNFSDLRYLNARYGNEHITLQEIIAANSKR